MHEILSSITVMVADSRPRGHVFDSHKGLNIFGCNNILDGCSMINS